MLKGRTAIVLIVSISGFTAACGAGPVKNVSGINGTECPAPRDGSYLGVPTNLSELVKSSTLIVSRDDP